MKLSAKEAAEVYAARNKHKGDVMERREKWTYIETKHAAKIDCGEFELRPGWNGTLDANELRRLLQRAVTEHNQHAVLVEQRGLLTAALRECVSLIEHDSELAQEIAKPAVLRAAKDALAAVEQGEGRE